jgi:hypothetical protein
MVRMRIGRHRALLPGMARGARQQQGQYRRAEAQVALPAE